MPRTTIHESDAITVWHDGDHRLIHHQIHKFCADEPFRQALTAGTDAMIANRAIKWLSDDRANGALSPADEVWATQAWFPRTLKAGWKYWAVVLPTSVVGQMNVSRFMKMYQELGIDARVFTEPASALEWLASLEPPAGARGSESR